MGTIGVMVERDQITGSVERITFYNEENGYTNWTPLLLRAVYKQETTVPVTPASLAARRICARTVAGFSSLASTAS